MLDPLVGLAFGMHANPGVYALLLGSGVSRPANIPTGWEIVLDLIQRYANALGKDTRGDPASWYSAEYREEANYSILLERVAPTQAERSALLRGYFEPSQPPAEEGDRTPTAAHRAVAQLVESGHVRIVLTTNFDRLLESALAERGIAPTVIAHPNDLEGAPPLQHLKCVVIKLHGDYVDMRLRNTQAELNEYDERTNALLDRVLADYGLIICGWSGDWDQALRDAIARCARRRYTLYWAARSALGTLGGDLLVKAQGALITIPDANTFFAKVRDAVLSLGQLQDPSHPLTPALAEATVKRHLRAAPPRIALHDLVVEETTRLCARLGDKRFASDEPVFDIIEPVVLRMQDYESLCRVVTRSVAAVAYYQGQEERRLVVDTIKRVARSAPEYGDSDLWVSLGAYPALLLLYSACLAALAAGDLELVGVLLRDLPARRPELAAGIERVNVARVLQHDVAKKLPDVLNHYSPLSNHMFALLREPLHQYLPDEVEYTLAFDRLELFIGLAYVDLAGWEPGQSAWGPGGRFVRRHMGRRELYVQVESEIADQKLEWGLLKAGLFGGKSERLRAVWDAYMEVLRIYAARG